MKYCGNCGSELEQGASFCTLCGYRINGYEENSWKQREKGNESIIEGIKLYTKALDLSGKGLRDFLEKGRRETALAFLGSFIILQGILFLWISSTLYNNLFNISKSLFIKFAYKMAELTGERVPEMNLSEMVELQSMMNVVRSYFPLNSGKIFFYGLLLATCMLAMILLGLFISAKIIDHSDGNTDMLLKLVSIAVIPLAYGGIAANLLAYISASIAAVVYLVSFFVFIGVLYTSSKNYLIVGGATEVAVAVVITITLVLQYKIIEGVGLEAITKIITSISSYI